MILLIQRILRKTMVALRYYRHYKVQKKDAPRRYRLGVLKSVYGVFW
jgi:hypothetical protein